MIRVRTIWLSLLLLPAISGAQSITAESGIVMDAESGKILWSRNGDEQLYPASTTKIMTALLLIENCKPDDVITAPSDVTKVKEASMHLKPGERIRAKDMLYALMLRSANDGCYAVAMHISGSVEKFSELMNQRAAELGCTHTHFHNPNGLNDTLHYTTAHDLALMGKAAMQYAPFRQIVHTEKTKINRGTNWKDLWMVNHNKILKRDPTCDGIKTGWTIPAGHCFVGSASREGWRVITVVMKSKSWENDTENLFNWAFSKYRRQDEVAEGQDLGLVSVKGGVEKSVRVVADQSAYSLIRKYGGEAEKKLDLPNDVLAPIEKNQRIGDLVIRDQDGFEQRVPVVSGSDVPMTPSAALAKAKGDGRLWIGGGLVVGAYLYRGRTRRKFAKFPALFKTR